MGASDLVAAETLGGCVSSDDSGHVVVDDPSLFPLQPSEPIIPAVVILASLYLILRGGGSWSRDLKATRSTEAGTSDP